MSEKNTYRSILKGSSIFGGVQMFQILVSLIRGKFVALFLGPDGMGISSLFSSSANTLQQFSSLGLNLALVKEVAATKESPDHFKAAISVAKHLVLFTSLLGALICVVFSPLLSRITFGNEDYAWQFILLALFVFFTVAGNGKLSILQGLQQHKRITIATVVGSLTGLLIGVPLYYLFGEKGIVPAMISISLSLYIALSVGVIRSVEVKPVRFIWDSHRKLVKKLLSLGLILMAGTLIGTGCTYLINLFLRHFGDLSAVGLYQAANSMTNQYASVIFTALSLDYFPRLAAAASDNREMNKIVNRQSEIVALLAGPLATLFIALSPLIIKLLLTEEFLEITSLLRWMGLGVVVRAFMYPMGYITFAKDNKRLFFWMEGVLCNVITLSFSCVGFFFFGLIGLGYALLADNLVCFLLYYFINRRLYGYGFSRKLVRYYIFAIAVATVVFIICEFAHDSLWSNILSGAIIAASMTVCFLSLKNLIKGEA